jgi:hypothetical protein
MSAQFVRSSAHNAASNYGETRQTTHETVSPRPYEHDDMTLHRCTHCSRPYSMGELLCSFCGIPFVNAGKTDKMQAVDPDLVASKNWPVGLVSVELEAPITLQCGDQHITVSVPDSVIIGRKSKVADDPEPNVMLNMFGAEDKGVSRQHIRIMRKQDLLYVTDLGSSNGTFLNGRALLRNCPRVLRNSDELQLGLLKLKVRFE